jgi:hypothetical protein
LIKQKHAQKIRCSDLRLQSHPFKLRVACTKPPPSCPTVASEMSKPNDDAIVQRCGCYSDAPAVVECIRLLQQQMPSLKALAVPTPSDVATAADTALLVQVGVAALSLHASASPRGSSRACSRSLAKVEFFCMRFYKLDLHYCPVCWCIFIESALLQAKPWHALVPKPFPGDCLLKMLLLPSFPKLAPLIKLLPLRFDPRTPDAIISRALC